MSNKDSNNKKDLTKTSNSKGKKEEVKKKSKSISKENTSKENKLDNDFYLKDELNKNDYVNKERISKKTKKRILILAIKIIVCIVVFYLVFTFAFGLKRMSASYMNPSIKDGDLILYYRIYKDFEVGDVVVVHKNNKDYVLRIVATSGQTLDISKNSELLVDDYLEPYNVYYQTKDDKNQKFKFPYKVPLNKYFVLADHRSSNTDSRMFGPVSKEEIKGKVISKLQVRGL